MRPIALATRQVIQLSHIHCLLPHFLNWSNIFVIQLHSYWSLNRLCPAYSFAPSVQDPHSLYRTYAHFRALCLRSANALPVAK